MVLRMTWLVLKGKTLRARVSLPFALEHKEQMSVVVVLLTKRGFSLLTDIPPTFTLLQPSVRLSLVRVAPVYPVRFQADCCVPLQLLRPSRSTTTTSNNVWHASLACPFPPSHVRAHAPRASQPETRRLSPSADTQHAHVSIQTGGLSWSVDSSLSTVSPQLKRACSSVSSRSSSVARLVHSHSR